MSKFLRYSFLTLLMAVVNFASAADKWVLTAPTALQTGDVVVIVDQTSSKAMSNTSLNNNGAPNAVAVTLSTDEISSTVDAGLQWEVTVSDAGYQFNVAGTENYLYVTATNNGVKVGSGERNTFTIETGGDNNGYYLNNVSGEDTRYIGCYNSQDWRCYGSINNNIKGNNNAFYKKVVAEGPLDANVTISGNSIEVGETAQISFPEGLDIIFESDDTSIATVDEDGVVTGVAEGETTITAMWDANDEYNGGETEFTITVTEAIPATNYIKVTSASQLVAGNEYILVAIDNNKAMGAQNNKIRNSVDVTVADDKVAITDEAVAVMTLGGSTGAWTFSTTDGFLSYSGSSNEVYSAAETSDATNWIVTTDFQLESANVPGRVLKYNSGSPRFACYASSQKAAVLFVKEGSAENTAIDPELSFEPSTMNLELGASYSQPTINCPDEIRSYLTINSDNPDVAFWTSQAGLVVVEHAGTATLTATYDGNYLDGKYKSATATLVVTVTDPNAPGTENNPYTVEQARAAIDAGTGVTGVYAKGVVSEIVTAYNSDYGNITYNISADGTTEAVQLQAYRGKSYNGDDFNSEDDIQVGDEVVIYGNLKKYNTTYEFEANNQLVSLERSGKQVPELSWSEETVQMTVGDIRPIPTLNMPEGVERNDLTTSNPDVINFDAVENEDGTWTIFLVAKGAGTATITGYTAENDTYQAGTCSFTVNVTEPITEPEFVDVVVGSGRYQKVTDASELEAGKRYLLVYEGADGNNVFSGMASANYGQYVELAAEEGIIDNNVDEAGAPVVLQEGDNGNWYIMLDESFLAYNLPTGTKKNNNLFVVDSWSEVGTQWTIDLTEGITNAYNAERKLQFNTGSPRFACYTGSQANVTLYKEIADEPETVAVTISESTYATFYYETQAFEIPAGVTASAVVREGSSLTEIPAEGIIPAGCPVLLHGEAGEYAFTVTTEEGVMPTANSLIGSEEGGTYNEEGYKYYVLSYKNKNKLPEEVGFYFLSGSKGAYAKVKAHQAYMRVTTTQANEAGYSLFETTGISTVETAATESDAPMYNLAGQRVNGSYRGVVIQNGVKKVNK